MSAVMISSDQELQVTLNRIRSFQEQVTGLRWTEADTANYRATAGGFLAEIDRMQLDVREFLAHHPDDSTPKG
jgi:hypothetical protein